MKNILFPTDFSDAAHTAFIYALKFANIFNAGITILHVYDLPVVDVYPLHEPATDIYEIAEANHHDRFNEEMQKLSNIAAGNSMGHIIIKNFMMYGDLNYNINAIAREHHADFIIMGTNGAEGFTENFLSSTAASVVKNTMLPVLAIPHETIFQPIKKIAFTTQYNDSDNDALEKAIDIAGRLQAKIQCLNVVHEDEVQGAEEKIAQFEMDYRDSNVGFTSVQGENTEEAILNFITAESIDMLIMRTHKLGFFEGLFHTSLTKKLTHHIKIPLLIYHEE